MKVTSPRGGNVRELTIEPGDVLAEVSLSDGVTLMQLADAIVAGIAVEEREQPAAPKPAKKATKKKRASNT